MSLSTSTADMLYAVGHWLLEEQRPLDAVEVFRTMLMTAPQDERGWLGLGVAHERVGQNETALELYQLGESAVPTSFRCSLARARLLRLVEKEHEEAYERAEERALMHDEAIASAIAQERAAA